MKSALITAASLLFLSACDGGHAKEKVSCEESGGSFYVTRSGTTCVPDLNVTDSTLEMQLESLQNQYALNPHFLFEQENGLAGPATIELITRMMVLKISHQMSTRDYGP